MKKKKLFIVLFTMLIIAFNGCSNEDLNEQKQEADTGSITLTDTEVQALVELKKGTKIEIEDAKSKALDAINSFSETKNSFKSYNSKTIESVQILTISENLRKTKSEQVNEILPDTVAYLFNFANDGGYALISADTRIPEDVLICTEEGVLDTENPASGIFLEGTETFIIQSIEKVNNERDSILQELEAKILADDPELAQEIKTKAYTTTTQRIKNFFGDYEVRLKVHEWEFSEKVSPMSTTEMTQGAPFNNFLSKTGCSNRPPAGCVAIAAAQIMAYWKYPTNFEGRNINWDNLNKYTANTWRSGLYKNWSGSFNDYLTPQSVRDDAAHIAKIIGSNIGMNYGCDASGAQTENAVKYLNKLGYKTYPVWFTVNYDYSTVLASLRRGCPLIASGYAKKTKKKFLGIKIHSNYSEGHAWIIDGFLTRKQLVETQIIVRDRKGSIKSNSTSKKYNYSTMFHMNWGWGGSSNGYFAAGSFNSNKVDANSGTTKLAESNEKYNYQYKVEVFPYIRK